MNRRKVRHAWEEISETYARTRDPSGPDAKLLDDLVERLGPNPVVLDVGCGDGARTLANLPAGCVGLDISRAGLDLAAAEVPAARLLQGDMVAMPLETGSVDAVTAYHAVFHVPRDQHPAVYREFARVLRPNGHLLMTLPSGRFETIREGWMGGRMFFSAPGREATLRHLQEAGFTDIETRTTSDPLGSSAEFVFARCSG